MTTTIDAEPTVLRPAMERDLATVPTEVLEADLVALAAWENAGLFRTVSVLRELDARSPWAAWGCRSAQHWLSWKCGLGYTAATERLRVAHALPLLPVIAAGFRDGHLSWSKVRELTRVATPEDDETWAEIGRWSTAAQLVRLTRARRRVTVADALAQLEARSLSTTVDDDGSVVICLRLPADRAASVLAAVDAATAPTKGVARTACAADALVELVVGRAARTTEVVVHLHRDSELGQAGHSDAWAETDDGVPLAPEVAACMACDADSVTTMTSTPQGPVERDRRRGPTARQRRWLAARHPTCQVPGCHHAGGFEAHHIVEHRHGGRTRRSNLCRLCWYHHRWIHLRGLVVTMGADRVVTITTPDGSPTNPPITVVPPVVPQPVDSLRLGQWQGDRLDLDACFLALARREFSAEKRSRR